MCAVLNLEIPYKMLIETGDGSTEGALNTVVVEPPSLSATSSSTKAATLLVEAPVAVQHEADAKLNQKAEVRA